MEKMFYSKLFCASDGTISHCPHLPPFGAGLMSYSPLSFCIAIHKKGLSPAGTLTFLSPESDMYNKLFVSIFRQDINDAYNPSEVEKCLVG
jgi:hypothetical protein